MLKDLTVTQYIDILADKAPTPGGGSSLAVVVANALALCEMALNVTTAKLEKKELDTTELKSLCSQFSNMRAVAMSVIDQDKVAFENILTAMRMPKESDAQKAARHANLQTQYKQSAQVCLKLMQTAADGFLLADKAIALSDNFVVSDAIIGKTLLATATRCCQHNVDVNAECITDATVKAQLLAIRDTCLDTVKSN